jgi:hypothetical protein
MLLMMNTWIWFQVRIQEGLRQDEVTAYEFKKEAEKQEKARLEQLKLTVSKLLMIMFQNGKLLLMLCPW